VDAVAVRGAPEDFSPKGATSHAFARAVAALFGERAFVPRRTDGGGAAAPVGEAHGDAESFELEDAGGLFAGAIGEYGDGGDGRDGLAGLDDSRGVDEAAEGGAGRVRCVHEDFAFDEAVTAAEFLERGALDLDVQGRIEVRACADVSERDAR
jgi:hypothetical protein